MGSWFSNMHIRKGEADTENSVTEAIGSLLAAQEDFSGCAVKAAEAGLANPAIG